MRILHVVPTYLPATRYGGPIYAVHGLAKALAARGHTVDVFTTNVDGSSISAVPVGTPVGLDGISVHYFSAPYARLYWSPSMRRALEHETASYDVVHLHSVFLYPTAAAARAARHHGVPYVIAPRGMLVPELISRRSRVTKHAWLRVVERHNLASAAAVHFTSMREWDDARRLRLTLPSPFVVPNGIDLPPLAGVRRESNLIVFIGRISWKKGLDLLIESLPLVPGARAEIAGNDEEGESERLREIAVRSGVSDRVAFRGHVDGPEKQALLERASVFVLPSMSENFGNAVLEAMASGVPVVVTREVGLAAEVEASGAGVVTERKAEPLARAIAEVLGGGSRAAEMGANGRRAVERGYTWGSVAAQMEAQYERLRG